MLALRKLSLNILDDDPRRSAKACFCNLNLASVIQLGSSTMSEGLVDTYYVKRASPCLTYNLSLGRLFSFIFADQLGGKSSQFIQISAVVHLPLDEHPVSVGAVNEILEFEL